MEKLWILNAGGGVFSKIAPLPCLPTSVWVVCPMLQVPQLWFLFSEEIVPYGVSMGASEFRICLCLHLELALFPFMAKLYSIICISHIFCIHSAVDGCLGCLCLLAVVSSAAVNIHVQVCEYLFSRFCGIYMACFGELLFIW